MEVVDSDATRDNISSKSKKLVHVKERVSEELSNNSKYTVKHIYSVES